MNVNSEIDRRMQALTEVCELLNTIQPPLTFDQKQGIIDGTKKLRIDDDGSFTIIE